MSAALLSFPAFPQADAALREFDLPKLAHLGGNYHAACFSVMKLLAARGILDSACQTGALKPGMHVIESTSGTFGLALAMLRPHYGYDLTLISDPAMDAALEARLTQMGARVEILRQPLNDSYQLARLARLDQLLAETPGAFHPAQYHHPGNAAGYARLADDLAQRFARIDVLVGTVGSGGSMSGTARALRKHFPHLRVVGVDTPQSVLFGQPNGMRALRGLGNSLMPRNLDRTQFNQIHWVTAAEAFRACRELLREHGLFMGATSGAAHLVARWVAAQAPGRTVVSIFPDEGHRYTDTVYNDTYLATLPGSDAPLPTAPQLVHPEETLTQWSCHEWARRA